VALSKAADAGRRRASAIHLTTGTDPEPAVRMTPELDLSGLRERERTCLVLFFYEGLSVAEISVLIEVPPGTVKTWMHRGRARLRESLTAERERS
jgi:RNA polymerase sigma-70 factor (ECF subfamily)